MLSFVGPANLDAVRLVQAHSQAFVLYLHSHLVAANLNHRLNDQGHGMHVDEMNSVPFHLQAYLQSHDRMQRCVENLHLEP